MEYLVGLLVFSPFSAVALGFVSIYLIAKKRVNVKLNYWNLGLLFLFLWSIFVGIINKSFYSSLGSVLILIYFLVSQLSNRVLYTKDFLYKVLNALVLFTTISSVIGIVEKIAFILLGDTGHRIYSTFGNPNMTGSWFCSVLFIVWFLVDSEDGKVNQRKYSLCAFLITIALLLTGSRGAYISLAVTTIVSVMLKGFSSSKKLTFLLVLTASVIFISSIFAKSDLILNYILAHPFHDSLNPRVKIWSDTIAMIKAKPIAGWGLLASYELGSQVLTTYGQASIHAHNLWLSLFSSLGVVGLTVYLYMKIKLYKNIFTLYKNNRSLGLLSLSINLIVVIHGLVDMSLFAPQLGILFSITGALTNDLTKEKSFILTPARIKKQILLINKNKNSKAA